MLEGRAEFERDLDSFVDAADFANAFIGSMQADDIITEVINQALKGRGPGGARFKKYSKSYAAIKRQHGGIQNNWMQGIDTHEHMLARKNFAWKFEPPDKIVLVWTPANAEQAAYGPRHNEGDGKMPRREWMHLEAPATAKTVDRSLEKVQEKRVLEFHYKWGR